MNKRKYKKDYLVFSSLPLVLISTFIHASSIDAGTLSSTPKSLLNLYTQSPNDTTTSSGSNLFQNEYQFRQSNPKTTSQERYKLTPSGSQASSVQALSQTPSSLQASEIFNDHMNGDLGSSSSSDYSYQENRGTTNVPDCKGRLKLNGSRGFITDGPGHYPTNLQCIWLIDSGRENDTIRIQFHQFNTECNYDYFYIFDGDSIYSPLIATLSGDMKDFSYTLESKAQNYSSTYSKYPSELNTTTNLTSSIYSSDSSFSSNAVLPYISGDSRSFEIKTTSGKAFIYFHSDTAQSMPGFYITYSINSCPLECSNRGECDYVSLTCKCKEGYYGDGCQYVSCPNNCTSPNHGKCDTQNFCICNRGYHGSDCSTKLDKQVWQSLERIKAQSKVNSIPARAFHQATVIEDIMWIIGGRSQPLVNTNTGIYQKRHTQMVFNLNLSDYTRSNVKLEGITGIDHLAELSGHSVAAKGSKVFIFGGIAMNNTILNSLTVLDTRTGSLSSLPSSKLPSKHPEEDLIPPVAVVGHTANIIDSHMYVFFGYNPFHGYLDYVQKFNLADNSWSLVERRGSYVEGCIGHTSTYDESEGLVYVYGGHNSQKSNSLYSFDPHTEVWTRLLAGPSSRYYHSSIIMSKQLIVFGGISYNMSHQSDQCFQQTYLTYDLTCPRSLRREIQDSQNQTILSMKKYDCSQKCWQSIDDVEPNILKRHGHTIVAHDGKFILFGGFNGVILNDILFMNITSCSDLNEDSICNKPGLGLNCYWNPIESKCENRQQKVSSSFKQTESCSKSDLDSLMLSCKARETCTDCLNTNIGCVWCGIYGRCQYNKCTSSIPTTILDSNSCDKDSSKSSSRGRGSHDDEALKNIQTNQDLDNEVECKRIKTCYMCHLKPYCTWQSEECTYNSSTSLILPSPSSITSASSEEFGNLYDSNQNYLSNTIVHSNSTRFTQRYDQVNRLLLASLISPSICDEPCHMRHSCSSCTQTKCIWCSTTEQCVDSSAYFVYYAMGQCMHYVAHNTKCSVSSCSDIETCDKCLTNPKCGWLNDISNTGRGRCIEGTSVGPSFVNVNGALAPTTVGESNSTLVSSSPFVLPSWYYTTCPNCQCNGHSYCKPNSSVCLLPCQDNTEGTHCERCIPGYFGDPINGGSCKPCRCNGHAQSCNRENGKCYCSTKGIIGHTCNKCDDQNHYIGDPSGPGNGTCYYNLTTDYQYTFNMSKAEDHFYSDINFINVPLRKDSDVDFNIHCSRLALVNITSGTSYKNRKPIHTNLECTNFRLRFPHDRYIMSEANQSFFVHVYKFQTPFTLSISFSQHRTIYLPQFFFTFSSCFLFFFTLSGLFWKIKHEYDLYVRRQRQFIEMEQMASRPFSTILLEMFKPSSGKNPEQQLSKPMAEPTPISFEPCFGSNIGVLSLFVQLPGRPNLAIGSALVSLSDEAYNICDDSNSVKRTEKEHASVQNM